MSIIQMKRKKSVVILPVEVTKEGAPLDPALYEHFKAFCEREFKAVPDVRTTVKTWGAFTVREEGGLESCIGILSLQWQMVCPTFHLTRPTERDEIPPVHHARDNLVTRAKAFLQDNGMSGLPIHIYCAPEAQEMWKGFLETLEAKSANLFTIRGT